MPNGDVQQNSLLLNRPLSDTGLPGGNLNINGDGSSTPIDYYVEALAGERLLVARAIIHILAATDIDAREYGDIGGGLANGIDLFIRRSGISIKVSNDLPIKINEDWGRWDFDSVPIKVGPTNKTPVWQSRWTFTRYGSPWGIVLEEGDRIGIRLNDNLGTLTEQTVIIQGVHLGDPSPLWTTLLVPPST